MYKPLIPMTLLALLPVSAGAQQRLDESVAVDGRYKADVVRMERISTFPKRVRATLTSDPLAYDETGVTADFLPAFSPLAPTGWRADRTLPASRGYLDLALGSWLNADLSAGFHVLPAESTTTLDVRLQHNSTSLWRPELAPHLKGARRYEYNEVVGFDAGHTFDGLGRLSASAQYRLDCFNYYATLPWGTDAGKDYKAPTQTLNDFSVRVGWSPLRRDNKWDWHVDAAYRYFGYRALYLPTFGISGLSKGSGGRENHLQLSGHVAKEVSHGHSWDLGLRLDGLIYGNEEWVNNPKSYTHFTLTPGYEGVTGPWTWRLGIQLDVSIGAGRIGHDATPLHFAPDLRASWTSGFVTLYALANGGDRLQTLAAQSVYDPYGLPALWSSIPAYTPVNAAVGVTLHPFGGMTIGAEWGYKVERDIEMGGWYQTLLNRGSGVKPTLPGGVTDLELRGRNVSGIDLHGGRLSVRASYEARQWSVSGDFTWQTQKGTLGWANGYDRPRYTASLQAAVRPIDPLRIEAGLDWRGHRAVYSYAAPDWDNIVQSGTLDPNDKDYAGVDYPLVSYRLRDITDLHLTAAWSFTKRIEGRIEGHNLLNRHVDALPGLPAMGITLNAGVSVLF